MGLGISGTAVQQQFSLYEVEFATEVVGTIMTILSYAQYSELPLW